MLKVSSDRNNTYEALRLYELPDMHMESSSRQIIFDHIWPVLLWAFVMNS